MEPRTYRITVRGELSERFAAAFDGLRAEPASGGTALVGNIVDQSELYGVLDRLRDLGVELVRVEREEP